MNPCLFLTVYSVKYFTAASNSLELAEILKKSPTYTNESAY